MVGGYIYFNSKKENKENPLAGPVISQEFSAKTSKQDLPEYSRGDLGFSFVITKDATVKDDSEEEFNKRGNGDFRKNFTGYVEYEPPTFAGAVVVLGKENNFDNNPFAVWVFNNDNNLTIEQWFGKYWYYPFVWGVFDYTSKGHIALDTEATISGELAKSKIISYQPGEPKFIYISKNQKMYLIRIIDDPKHFGDQILASFKFL